MNLADPLPPVADGDVPMGFELVATVPAGGGGPVSIQELELVPGEADTIAVVDTRGLVWLIEDGETASEPLLDLRDAGAGFERPGPEAGLRSLAFHPDYATRGADGFGLAYVAYSATVASAPRDTAVFEADGADSVVFHDVYAEVDLAGGGGPRELFRVEQPFGNHNAGQLNFDPAAEPGDADHGLLYVGLGDGGGGNDPLNAAEDLSQIHGKILRLDPLADGGAAYGVPGSNPFVGEEGALGEIWAYGFRNPQQFSFDGDLILASDIGQNTIEEVNVVRRGADHGWDDREGTLANTNGTIGPLPADDPEGLQYPLTQYDHEEITGGNAAVGGGFVYRGDAIPELRGSYVFSNFPTGRLFSVPLDDLPAALADGRIDAAETRTPLGLGVVDEDGRPITFAEISGNASGRVDLRLGLDADGEILAFSKQTGDVYRLTAAPEEDAGGGDGDGDGGDGEPGVRTPLAGTAGDNRLVSTAEDEVITTLGGRDRIAFKPVGDGEQGSDVVTDFDVNGGGEGSFDTLLVVLDGQKLQAWNQRSFVFLAETLAARDEDGVGASVDDEDLVLAFGGGDVVRLERVVDGEELRASDFILA